MGTLVGHVAPGFGFFIVGLWHLYNHIKLHAQYPNSYASLPWFPTSKIRYFELFLIMGGCVASIAMELFISPDRHQPFDSDGTIPSNHLHNFEHSNISLTFLVYAAFALALDKVGTKAQHGLTQLIGAIAFAQMFLLFHFHSTDHMGPEGLYHLLLQIVIVISIATTLMGIGNPKSFIISFVRSVSIIFQGLWLMVMGFMLWTPELLPKGCFLHLEEGHKVARCSGDEALYRAKSLIVLQFSWYVVGITSLAVLFYLFLVKAYGEKVEYTSLIKEEEQEGEDFEDIESQKKRKIGNSTSFIQMGKVFSPIDMER